MIPPVGEQNTTSTQNQAGDGCPFLLQSMFPVGDALVDCAFVGGAPTVGGCSREVVLLGAPSGNRGKLGVSIAFG
jgi:hypothetical protein